MTGPLGSQSRAGLKAAQQMADPSCGDGGTAVWGRPPTGCDQHDLNDKVSCGTENRTDGNVIETGGNL